MQFFGKWKMFILRGDVLQLFEQPLVLPAHQLLVPEHHVLDREEILILLAQLLVLGHVILDEVDEGGAVELVEAGLVDALDGGRSGYKEKGGDLSERVARALAVGARGALHGGAVLRVQDEHFVLV